MSVEQSDAIVLRSFPWSETSLIAHIYTRDFGKLSVLAKGARRPKSPFEAALDLLSFSRVVFIAKSGDALDILTEAKLLERFRAGSKDLLRLYCGYYVAELLDRLTDKGDKQPEVFELGLSTLRALAKPDLEVRATVLRFELQMLRCLGQLPSFRKCAQCGMEVESATDVVETELLMFGMLAGGVLCASCRPGSPQLLRIPAATRITLERISATKWQDVDLMEYPVEHRAAIRGWITKYLTVVLDRKLQMHPYLEELGR
ncbi:MAG: DNA repair protein RecO [Pirellulaceae bacterium]